VRAALMGGRPPVTKREDLIASERVNPPPRPSFLCFVSLRRDARDRQTREKKHVWPRVQREGDGGRKKQEAWTEEIWGGRLARSHFVFRLFCFSLFAFAFGSVPPPARVNRARVSSCCTPARRTHARHATQIHTSVTHTCKHPSLFLQTTEKNHSSRATARARSRRSRPSSAASPNM
jgi:hypothetical protein